MIKKETEIHIPMVFTSKSHRQFLSECGYWLTAYVHTISRQDIMVFAAAQYLKHFTVQKILDVIGGSPYRVRQSIQRLQEQGYIEYVDTVKAEKKYRYCFQQYMLFDNKPVEDVVMLAFPVWVMGIISKCNLTANDLFLYGALWKWQYDSRVNKTHTDAYYTETNAEKWLGMSERAVKYSRKKLIDCQLIRKVGSHKAVIAAKKKGHLVNDYYVVGDEEEYSHLVH